MQTFVDLVARHEARFYNFVHQVHSKGEGLFDNLMKWIELFINFVRDGLPTPISLEFLLPHAGKERREVMAEVDAIVEYHRKLKVAHQEKVKRRMLRVETAAAVAMEEDPEAAFMSDVMKRVQIGPASDDVHEVIEEDSDEDEDDSEEEEEDEDVFELALEGSSTASSLRRPKPLPPVPGQLVPIPKSKKLKKERVVIDPPKLKHIPLLVPLFVELIRDELSSSSQ